ncbi:MAG: glycosyltransferase family 4 protein [Bacteroidia bacterium]|nr:glycosyltransferase family 4 protein [Bacteroidia bacterium]
MSKTIGLLTTYPRNTVPGLRFRIEQYITLLAREGYHLEWRSFFNDSAYRKFRNPSTSLGKRVILFLEAIQETLSESPRKKKWQGIYLYREATLLGTTFFERLWTRDLPILLDFDDAIWIPDVSESNRAFGWLKSAQKVPALLRMARVVTVCNQFLADYARQYANDVRIIPTTIDTELYRPVPKSPSDRVTIGWTGSYTTLKHLKVAENALLSLHRKYKDRIRFRFIGAPHYQPPFPAEVLPWRSESEVEDLQPLDIGLMPLPNDTWSRGKCALKALQYMALGIPPIISPVGMNCEVVEEGYNGLFAQNEDEWVDKISWLIENPSIRARIGQAARDTVENRYSVHANQSKYVAAFDAAFGRDSR